MAGPALGTAPLRAQGHAGFDAALRGVAAAAGRTRVDGSQRTVLQALQPLLGDRARPWVQGLHRAGDDVPLPADLAGPASSLAGARCRAGRSVSTRRSPTACCGVVVDGPAHRRRPAQRPGRGGLVGLATRHLARRRSHAVEDGQRAWCATGRWPGVNGCRSRGVGWRRPKPPLPRLRGAEPGGSAALGHQRQMS